MSNHGLRRVLENRDPRGYFHALSNSFTEEYQRSRENASNQIVPPSRYQGQTVPMTVSSEGRLSTNEYGS